MTMNDGSHMNTLTTERPSELKAVERSRRLVDTHPPMRIAIACNRVAFGLEDSLLAFLLQVGHDVVDLGAQLMDPVDYSAISEIVAKKTSEGGVDLAVVLAERGFADWIREIEAEVPTDLFKSSMSPGHLDLEVLAVGERVVSIAFAEEIVTDWLETLELKAVHPKLVA